MNITDVPVPEIAKDTTLTELAQKMALRQTELEDHYFKIEKRKDRFWWPDKLDDRDNQIAIKDSLWRIMEEVGEALEARRGEVPEKVWEELADGLHFLIRLNLNVCMPHLWEQAFNKGRMNDTYSYMITDFVESAGCLGNTLKLKAWKQTDVPTDVTEFSKKLLDVNKAYLGVCWALGLTHHTLFQYYWRKSEVNLFRIRSKY